MEHAVEQHRIESKTFEVKMNQVLNKNERLLEQVMSKDIVNLLVNPSMENDSVNVHECQKCLTLETELQTKRLWAITALKDELRNLKENPLIDNNEEATVLRDLVNHIKANYPLDPLLESALKQSPSASGSQPSGNTKKDKIQQTQSHVVKPKGTAHVQHSKLNANYELKCVKCNSCMLSDNHDLCVLDFINNVNARAKSRSVKKNSKRKVCKPTRKVFTNIGYIWRPTGRTFTIVRNACPLTRITTTTEVPLRKSSALDNKTPKPVVTLVYLRKPRKSKTSVPIINYKVIKSITANNSEPSQSRGSIVSNVPSSSLDEFTLSKLFSVKFRNDHVEKILGYGDYQIRNAMISRVYYLKKDQQLNNTSNEVAHRLSKWARLGLTWALNPKHRLSLSFKKIYKPTNNNLRTSSNTSRANQDNTPRINRDTGYDNQTVVNVAGASKNVGTPVVQQSGIQCYNCKEYRHLNAEQADWRDDTDDEPEDQELETHYLYMAHIQEVTPDAADNSGPILDAEPFYDREHDDQDDDDLAKERDLLASLIEKLKFEIDDNKNRNKFLESSNKALVDKLKGEIEDFKTKNKSLESSNNHFKEANNELSKTNQLMFKDLKKFQAELDRYHDVNYASKVAIDCAKAKGDLMSYKMESEKSFNEYTRKINDLNQTISEMKKELFAHQETISIMSQEKEAQIKFYKTREDKEIDKVIALENKVKVLDDIVYKTGQSVQTMNMLNRNCKTSFAKPEFLKKAQRANPRLYDIGCYNDNLALMLAPESDETIRLAKESRSKLSDLIRPFDYDQLNNLYDLFVPQREKSPEQQYFSKESKMSHTSAKNEISKESFNKQTTLLEKRMDESIPWDQKCKSSKELFKIKRSVDTIFDGVERCKQTIAKRTYFGHIDPFIQNTIEGNFCPQIRRINADLEKFHLCLKEEMFLNEIDRLSREYYYADHMNAILGVYTEMDEVTNLQCDYLEALEKCQRLEKYLSKSRTISKSFEALQKHAINLELDLQQYLKAQLQDKGIAISELKKLIEKMKGKPVETKFEKSSVIRQPNAFKSQRQSVLGKPAIFSDFLEKKDFLKSKSVTKNNVSSDFSKPVTTQILPQNTKSILKNINVISPEMYKVHTELNQTRTPQLPQDIRKTNKRVSFSTGVIPSTSVSRPQLKSNRMGDRVMSNNSQGKKQEVEDQRRNFKTRQPIVVPISTREPKQTVNQSVATSHKKSVSTDSTVKKPRNIIRKIYEQVRNASRNANILEPMTPSCSTLSNTPLSSNCFAARRYNSIHRRLHMMGNLKLLTNFVEKFLGTLQGYSAKGRKGFREVSLYWRLSVARVGSSSDYAIADPPHIFSDRHPYKARDMGTGYACTQIMLCIPDVPTPPPTDNMILFRLLSERKNGKRAVVSVGVAYNSRLVTKLVNVKFGNDHVAKIMGYGDYQIGNVTISRVYYVEGLGHNLFSVGQFCDSNLEVAFRQHTCYIRNLEGVDLLTGSRGDNLYTLSLRDMMASSPICLLSKASKTKSWLWHRRLFHLNFEAINHLARRGLVRGLPKLKFEKDHLCSACALGKSRKKPHKPKSEDTNQEKLYLLHMDLCGPMRVASVNGNKYILVIVDDYSRFTWVKCLRSKDEAAAFIINFLKMIQVRLKETIRRIITDNGTEFVNQTLREYYEKVGISH
ncbi:retrovirus-related pol polyprotein from transposon TNT 1-94 [Tanacetum coccineum]